MRKAILAATAALTLTGTAYASGWYLMNAGEHVCQMQSGHLASPLAAEIWERAHSRWVSATVHHNSDGSVRGVVIIFRPPFPAVGNGSLIFTRSLRVCNLIMGRLGIAPAGGITMNPADPVFLGKMLDTAASTEERG
jgi:hypothetical protein